MLLFPDKDSKIGSLVEFLILLALKKEGKLRGVDLINTITEQFQNWKPQSGTIYPALNRLLEKRGYITVEGKYYQISKMGEEILQEYLNSFIGTLLFLDNIFNYGKSLMDELDIVQSEHEWLQNHMPHVIALIDALPMVRSHLSGEKSSEIYVILRKIQAILQRTLQSIEKQIAGIEDEEKIVRVKIQ